MPLTLLYDRDCGLCVATATWLGRRTRPSRLRLLALEDAGSDATIAPLVAGRDLRATLHVVRPDGRVTTGAAAVLASARLVPRWRFVAAAFDNPLGHALLEPLYRQVSRHRRSIGRRLGLPASCPMPSAADRPR